MAVDKIRPIAVVPYVVVHVQYGKFQIISMSALRRIKNKNTYASTNYLGVNKRFRSRFCKLLIFMCNSDVNLSVVLNIVLAAEF